MNWVLALFAFAGVMAVMSTVVSVCVEAVHKVFGLRGRGLQDMLMALHDGVVAPLDPNQPDVTGPISGESTKAAKSFAKEMTNSPSYGSNSRYRHLSNIPFLGLLSRRFQNLSKLQFVEQLPRTAFGQSLAGMQREEVRSTLNRVVYEFDRFGSSQTDFFRARAKILTTLIALFIVVVGNFNAITLYTHLATNDATVSNLANLVATNSEAITELAEHEVAKAEAIGVAPDVSAEQLVSEVVFRIQEMSDMGFPVGRAYFPYCLNPDSHNCDVKTDIAPVKFPLIPYTSEAIPRMATSEGFVWFIGMVATAGLIGLGAPFWFNLFKSLAGLVMRSQSFNASARAIGGAVQTSGPARGELRRPKEPDPSLATPGDEPDLDLLTDAFLIVSGKDVDHIPRDHLTDQAIDDMLLQSSTPSAAPASASSTATVFDASAVHTDKEITPRGIRRLRS